ncbi:hypothetical protein PL18_15060 [Vibrio renipiscarius]|uniref:Uncharacterized protein n=1 Tax=Vibrio renipiscarius TaxID=1461322 RepID=A0A0C2K2M4_9VIBR|nr:hypothetical protein OJ16_15510 [Vibrio renipiscarius]KII78260.1 hypothetical protein PL18_15060 [Vibrio renipiscarius]
MKISHLKTRFFKETSMTILDLVLVVLIGLFSTMAQHWANIVNPTLHSILTSFGLLALAATLVIFCLCRLFLGQKS